MTWCEAQSVDYVRTGAQRAPEPSARACGRPRRSAKRRESRHGCSRNCTTARGKLERRAPGGGQAEALPGKTNPRFVVTTLRSGTGRTRRCMRISTARGEMENRIKECQLDLFADRTSTATLRSNQLRLWLSSFAYVLLESLRRLALSGTELAQATAGSIRLKLLKIGAVITVSVRRVKVAMSSAFPQQEVFDHAFDVLSAGALTAHPPSPPHHTPSTLPQAPCSSALAGAARNQRCRQPAPPATTCVRQNGPMRGL